MPQQVVTTCDICGDEGTRYAAPFGISHTYGNEGMRSHVDPMGSAIYLCNDHYNALFVAVKTWFEGASEAMFEPLLARLSLPPDTPAI